MSCWNLVTEYIGMGWGVHRPYSSHLLCYAACKVPREADPIPDLRWALWKTWSDWQKNELVGKLVCKQPLHGLALDKVQAAQPSSVGSVPWPCPTSVRFWQVPIYRPETVIRSKSLQAKSVFIQDSLYILSSSSIREVRGRASDEGTVKERAAVF